mmetsp:Transcript_18407/g.31751  ORF Transcript_18407/g.31751 Transcript_18407/m.31751 type:complete len:320 (-) Transcript_18407:62-1021(-)
MPLPRGVAAANQGKKGRPRRVLVLSCPQPRRPRSTQPRAQLQPSPQSRSCRRPKHRNLKPTSCVSELPQAIGAAATAASLAAMCAALALGAHMGRRGDAAGSTRQAACMLPAARGRRGGVLDHTTRVLGVYAAQHPLNTSASLLAAAPSHLLDAARHPLPCSVALSLWLARAGDCWQRANAHANAGRLGVPFLRPLFFMPSSPPPPPATAALPPPTWSMLALARLYTYAFPVSAPCLPSLCTVYDSRRTFFSPFTPLYMSVPHNDCAPLSFDAHRPPRCTLDVLISVRPMCPHVTHCRPFTATRLHLSMCPSFPLLSAS